MPSPVADPAHQQEEEDAEKDENNTQKDDGVQPWRKAQHHNRWAGTYIRIHTVYVNPLAIIKENF